MSETFLEKLDRVRMMTKDSGTWDLSEKDIEALKDIVSLAEISLLYRAKRMMEKFNIGSTADFQEVEDLHDKITGIKNI